jgi:hypothetical protein
MDRFQYSNLTVVEEGNDIKLKMNQMQETIIARFPQHATHSITP